MPVKQLSAFDRIGVAVIVFIGTLIGAWVAVASHVTAIAVLLFPGLLAWTFFGLVAGVVVCAIANGAASGLGLYAWIRLMNRLTAALPVWLGTRHPAQPASSQDLAQTTPLRFAR